MVPARSLGAYYAARAAPTVGGGTPLRRRARRGAACMLPGVQQKQASSCGALAVRACARARRGVRAAFQGSDLVNNESTTRWTRIQTFPPSANTRPASPPPPQGFGPQPADASVRSAPPALALLNQAGSAAALGSPPLTPVFGIPPAACIVHANASSAGTAGRSGIPAHHEMLAERTQCLLDELQGVCGAAFAASTPGHRGHGAIARGTPIKGGCTY